MTEPGGEEQWFRDLLRCLGVDPAGPDPHPRQALDEAGYVVLEELAGPPRLVRLREAFEAAVSAGGAAGAGDDTGTRHADGLAWADPAFDEVYPHPRVLAAAHHVLRAPFRVFQVSGRDPRPG